MKNVLILIFYVIFTVMVFSDDFRFMAVFDEDDPSDLIGDGILMEKNYLLAPWPWDKDNTPFTPNDPLTDIVFNDNRTGASSESAASNLLFDRISLLWQGNLSLTIEIGEDEIGTLQNEDELNQKVTEITDTIEKSSYQGIIWKLHLSENRDEYEPLISLWEGIRSKVSTPVSYSYSLAREEKPVPYLLEASDSVIIRAYDFSGRHSTFENAEESVENFIIRRKISPDSLILALPLYGRKYRSSDPEYWVKKIPYQELVDFYYPDRESNSEDYYYFNGPDMAQKKYSLAREKDLKGIALYPYEWDGRGCYSLKEAIASLITE